MCVNVWLNKLGKSEPLYNDEKQFTRSLNLLLIFIFNPNLVPSLPWMWPDGLLNQCITIAHFLWEKDPKQ